MEFKKMKEFNANGEKIQGTGKKQEKIVLKSENRHENKLCVKCGKNSAINTGDQCKQCLDSHFYLLY